MFALISSFNTESIPPAYLWCGRSAQSSLPGAIFVVCLLAMGIAYTAAMLKARAEVKWSQVAYFGSGIAIGLLVLSGPIERLSLQRSFVIYLSQQFVVVMVVAPLLLLGVPDWMLAWLPASKWLSDPWRFITNPLVAFLCFSDVFTLLHMPTVCDRVCHIHAYYYNVRFVLLFLGMILWWPLLSPIDDFPRLSYPVRILYLFLLMIPMTAVGAPIALAQEVLYEFYLPTPHPFGLTPLDDQVLGGLLMWVGQGLYLLACATAVFAQWVAQENAEERAEGLFDSAVLSQGDSL